MKHPLLHSTALLLILLLLIPAGASARPRGKLIFSHKDPAYDDKGPGTYSYPSSKLFSENPGIYDLRDFNVYDDGETIRFELRFQNRIPREGYGVSPSAFGFHLLMCDIYIDRDHLFGSGIQRTIAGRNVRFKPDNAWDRMVLISPMRESEVDDALRQKVEDLEMVNFKERVITPLEIHVGTYTLTAFVPKSKLGQPDPRWGYQVLVSGYDPEDRTVTSFYNIPVKGFSGPIQFGGGTNSAGSPQVIDILTPQGQSQSNWLGDFRPHTNPQRAELAFVPMIYSERGELLAQARTEMKLPGMKPPADKPGDRAISATDPVDDEGFLSQLRAEGYIMPVEDLAMAPRTAADTRPVAGKKLEAVPVEEIAVTEKKLTVTPATEPVEPLLVPIQETAKPVQEEKSRRNPLAVKRPSAESRLEAMRRQADADLGSTQWMEKEFGHREEPPLRRKADGKSSSASFDADLQQYLQGKKETPTPAPVADVQLEPASRKPQRSRSIFSRLFSGRKKTTDKQESQAIPEVRKPEPAESHSPEPELAMKVTNPVTTVSGGHRSVSPQEAECRLHAKELIRKAETYLERYPDDQRISMSDLRRAKLIGDTPHCPAGGRYVIMLEKNRPTVQCIDVNGSGHGSIHADEGGK